MSEIFNPNYNSLPKQVEINRRDIEELKSIVKQAYSTTFEYGDSTGIVTIALTSTSIPLDTDIGAYDRYLITADGYLLETISISLDPETDIKMVNAQMVADMRGPPGERGLQGLPGETGPAGPAGPAGTSFQITGYAETIAELPAVGQVGDAYAVGSADPKDIYVWVTSPQAEWVNLGSMQGPKGDTGETGLTPNITANASVGSGTGTPSVTVTKSGTDENPVLSFAFDNLKGLDGSPGTPGTPGLPGADGVTPDITMNASVSNTTGTPSVTVSKTGTTAQPVFSLAFENLKGDKGDKGDPGSSGGEVVETNHIKTNMLVPNNLIINEDKLDLPMLPLNSYNISYNTFHTTIDSVCYTYLVDSGYKYLYSTDGVNWKTIALSNAPSSGSYVIECYDKPFCFSISNSQLMIGYPYSNNSLQFDFISYNLNNTQDTLASNDRTKFFYTPAGYLYALSNEGNLYCADLSQINLNNFDPSTFTLNFTSVTASPNNTEYMWAPYGDSSIIFYSDGTTQYYATTFSGTAIDWQVYSWTSLSDFSCVNQLKYRITQQDSFNTVLITNSAYYYLTGDSLNMDFDWSASYPDPVEGGSTLEGTSCYWANDNIIWQDLNPSLSDYNVFYKLDITNNKLIRETNVGIQPLSYYIWTDGFNYYYDADSFAGNLHFRLENNKWIQVNNPNYIHSSGIFRIGNLIIYRGSTNANTYLFDPTTKVFSNTNIVDNINLTASSSNVFELFGDYFISVDWQYSIRYYKLNISESGGVYTLSATNATSSFNIVNTHGSNIWFYQGKYYATSNNGTYEITKDNNSYTLTQIDVKVINHTFLTKVGVLGFGSDFKIYKFNGTTFELFESNYTTLNLNNIVDFKNINNQLYLYTNTQYKVITQLDLKYTN